MDDRRKNYDVNDRTFHYTWIGASDLAKEGNWLWVTGKPVGVYTNWRGPGPNNGNNGSHTEDCMEWSFGGWNDSHCAGHLNFVCEIESNETYNGRRSSIFNALVSLRSNTQRNAIIYIGAVTRIRTWVVAREDGLIRSAVIKTDTGITNRPIVKLYPLEIRSTNDDSE
ncbi:unnamed protein product [Mytilus edulis]|uniref:C-type lectin domain-containing protein n=1 Tax=Mytilus edulis TaxID=6550 RepID=A0A8S3QC30_MYTED|nr:unnamed protein product [Mytilus edulis]